MNLVFTSVVKGNITFPLFIYLLLNSACFHIFIVFPPMKRAVMDMDFSQKRYFLLLYSLLKRLGIRGSFRRTFSDICLLT